MNIIVPENSETLKIGSQVRMWRTVKGIKQKALASDMKLSAAAMSYIENDITSPNLRQVESLARSLGISVQMLFTGPQFLHEATTGSN